MNNYKKFVASAVLATILLVPASAMAQDTWPSKPVRIMVPFSPGGAADTLARLVANDLSRTFGQQFVVENVTGAGGIVGLSQLVKAPADGYTFGINNISTAVIAPVINPNVTYDPATDFTYIAMLGGSPNVWTVNPEIGVSSVEDVVEFVKNSKTVPAYGSPGAGTLSHLTAMKYFSDEGLEMEHVAYPGAGAMVIDVVAGHIPMAWGTLSTARPQIDAGKLVAIAVSSEERDPAIPNVPTLAELGYPELTSTTWFGFVGPAGLPQEIVDRLNTEINRILDLPEVVARLEPEGLVGDRMTAADFAQLQADQSKIWAPIAAAAEIAQ
jgi:tripartite-type tricarboxylate transporter receptor subunit TctC